VNFYAGTYATREAGNYVEDVVLSNTKTYDIDGIFVYGSVIFWGFVLLLILYEPKRIPFTLKSIALFILIRSVFISLTHIGPFPTQIPLDSSLIDKFSFNGDLFFSAHTGLPFLMALVFGSNVRLKLLFILAAIFFGVVVLLAHIHYSIDVLSAFFITYTIYKMAEWFFVEDKRLFESRTYARE
jgi:hypothetical protein